MDRSREGKRGTMAALIGNSGLSRRRHRNEEEGAMELHDTGKLRDRSSKSDRDRYRDRDSRSKRSKVDRFIHGSVSEKGEDSAEESGDDVEEDDNEPGVSVQMQLSSPPAPPSSTLTNPSQQPILLQTPSSSVLPNHQHKRSLQAKVARSPAVWKVADEMIGVSIPRKARSAAKRSSHELSVSGNGEGGGGGSGGSGVGEPMMTHRQTSTSPGRPDPASTSPISPASSSAFLRKKVKIVSGNKHRQLNISKPPVAVQDIEFEVAEVLFGMTRQFQDSFKQEAQKQESKEANGLANEANSQISSPKLFSTSTDPCHSSVLSIPNLIPSGAAFPIVALPKRKKPRPVKLEDESPINPQNQAVPTTSVCSTGKVDDQHTSNVEVPLLKLEKSMATLAMMTGTAAHDISLHQISPPLSIKWEDVASLASSFPAAVVDSKEDATRLIKNPSEDEATVNCHNASIEASAADSPWEKKFKIDVMAPPPGKLYPEADIEAAFVMNHKPSRENTKSKNGDGEVVDRATRLETTEHFAEETRLEKILLQDHESKEQSSKDRNIFPQLDIKKVNVDGPNNSNQQQGSMQQQYKSPRNAKPDTVQVGALPLPMSVAVSAGGRLCPPNGYMGQLPYFQATYLADGSNRSSKAMQPSQLLFPQIRSKHCATHCYIANNIYYHQQIGRMNTFLASSPGGMPLLGSKSPYNLNAVPPSESILVNQLQGSFSGRAVAAIQNKACSTAAQFGRHALKDNNLGTNALFLDAPQQKHLVLQQAPEWSSSSSVLHAPASVSPLNQQEAAAAAAATAPRSGSAKQSAETSGNVANCTSAVTVSASARISETAVSFKYPNLPPNEAQYFAILQNNGCHFPIPAHAEAVPQFRGGSHAQVMPFFNGSFYGPQMIHPSHLQQHPQMQQIQQGHPSTSTSSASTHSHRHQHQLQGQQLMPKVGITGSDSGPFGALISKPWQNLQSDSACPLDEKAGTGGQCAVDGIVSNSQKGQMSSRFSGPFHPQHIALMSQAASFGSGGSHGDKRHPIPGPQQKIEIDLTSRHALAMPFASFSGATSCAASQGLDFSSMAQGHPLFQTLPEAARHGYRISSAAVAVSQQKMSHREEDGKASSMSFEEDRKMSPSGKTSAGFSQHSLAFSRAENEAPIVSILTDSAVDAFAPSTNLIPASMNGNRPSDDHFTSTAPAIACAGSSSSPNPHQHKQQQQHLIQQLQKQQHHLTPQAQSTSSSNNSSGILSDRVSSTSLVARFPSSLSGFPQTVHGNIPNSYTQWKSSARTATAAPSPPISPPIKSQLPQQQGRVIQVASSSGGYQTHISFGLNSQKTPQPGQELCGGINNSSPASGTTVVVSSQNTFAKTAGGNPSSSSSGKHVYQTLPLIQHHVPPLKNSPSSFGSKSSPTSNQNMPSIVGHPKITHPIQGSSKSQQQLQKHSFPQAQLYFSNTAHAQGHSSHTKAASAAVTAGFYQKKPSDQQHQQPTNSSSSSTGMLSLCSPSKSIPVSTATSDSTKEVATAASSVKGLPSQTVFQAAQIAAIAAHSTAAAVMAGGQHALMTVPGYPFMQAISNVSIKPAEHKSTAGNDNLNDCWQPEKK